MDQAEYVAVDGPDGTIILIPVGNLVSPVASPPPRNAPRRRSVEEKDAQMTEMIQLLAPTFGSLASWATTAKPYSALVDDCRMLAAESSVASMVQAFLQDQPSVRAAADMLVTAIAMSANADWRQTPSVVRATAARGWFIGRWLPTFLIIDGPIRRFLLSSAFQRRTRRDDAFKAARMFLCQDPTFRSVRNAFAHWSFGWEVVNRESWVVIYDVDTGKERRRLHQREGDALHLVAFTIVDVLREVFFRPEAQRG